MLLVDVNILVYAHRQDSPDHARFREWLESVINSDESFGLSELVLGGFLRIVTHPGVFKSATALETALKFTRQLREQPNCLFIAPRARHWDIFVDLCQEATARGNLVPVPIWLQWR